MGRTIFFPTKLPAIGYINLLFITLCIVRHAFIGSLTLREMKTALWDARAKWMSLGNVLSLPIETLQVIEGHACRLPSALSIIMAAYMYSVSIYTVERVIFVG